MKPTRRYRIVVASAFVFAGALAVLASDIAGQARGSTDPADLMEMEVATVGVDLNSGAPLALLHSDWNDVLPIWIGESEAQAIARELQGMRMPRPMTHDLLVSVIEGLGGELQDVLVHELRESTYIGMLRIRVGEGANASVREVDSRPSDALALAVRTGARLQVNRDLVTSAPDVSFISAEGERPVVRLRGVTVGEPSAEYRERFALPDEEGVVVLHATEEMGSRGIRQGDLILEVEGARVRRVMEFLEEVGHTAESTHLRVRLMRDGEEREGELLPVGPPGRVGA